LARLLSGLAIASVGCAIVLGVVGCGASPTRQARVYTIRFGLLQTVDQLPFYVMQAQGFAAAHGIKLVPQVVQSGPAEIAAVAAGKLDAAYPGSLPVLLAARTRASFPAEFSVLVR
jgi:ABC-type nitrate/sulfonate/bicarbonate transport system substrate-binding protein